MQYIKGDIVKCGNRYRVVIVSNKHKLWVANFDFSIIEKNPENVNIVTNYLNVPVELILTSFRIKNETN